MDGEEVRCAEIPETLRDEAQKRREELLDAASMFSDELMEAILEEKEIARRTHLCRHSQRHDQPRTDTGSHGFSLQEQRDPNLCWMPWSTISPILPRSKTLPSIWMRRIGQILLVPTSEAPLVALAFKLEDGPYGQLTYIRIYQGQLKKGDELYNPRSGKSIKVGRLIRMHADSMEDIVQAGSGDIVALFGIDCASGDTFVEPGLNLSLSSIYVPDPVISLAITPVGAKSSDNMAKALNRFTKEDPTFRTYVDPESKETIIQGMGELHLDVYVERMRREYQVDVESGAPQVAYREAISQAAAFDYTHKKQTGGAGQFGRVIGYRWNPCTKAITSSWMRSRAGVYPGNTSLPVTKDSKPP